MLAQIRIHSDARWRKERPWRSVLTREERLTCWPPPRLRPDGVELKCRRCKRVVMLSFADLSASEGHEIHPIC